MLRPLHELAADLGIDPQHVQPWGPGVAKLHLDALGRPDGARYVLVTAMTPNAKGVGKTTTAIALGDALRLRGHRAAVAIRQSSAGPTFGAKGGGGGGGAAHAVPLTRSLLHLSGDMHAVTSAHNLIAALLDNAWHHDAIDLGKLDVQWNRVADVNDRFLRHIEVGFKHKHRKTHYELTAASELMAVLALVDGYDHESVVADLRQRVGRIVLALSDDEVVTADTIGAAGAATALLVDAIQPNLMQSTCGTPLLLHAGPFANIAHGCSSIVADQIAMKGAEWVITEAGFGADVGAEKFFDIKCRESGIFPDSAVLVATVGAVRDQGSWEAGLANLSRQIGNVQRFGIPVVVAINRFPSDTPAEHRAICEHAIASGASAAVVSDGFATGARGAAELAEALEGTSGGVAQLLYSGDLPVLSKLEMIATEIYGADKVELSHEAAQRLERFRALGADELPVCVAKTPYSLSGDASLKGAPTGHTLHIDDIRLSAGAGFVYALTSKMLTMPGMGAHPRALDIDVDIAGEVTGIS